jgi:hypothetical protein
MIALFSTSSRAHAPRPMPCSNIICRGKQCKFIMVQLPERIDEASATYKAGYKTVADIGKERIRRAAMKIGIEGKGQLDIAAGDVSDLGFKVFQAGSLQLSGLGRRCSRVRRTRSSDRHAH